MEKFKEFCVTILSYMLGIIFIPIVIGISILIGMIPPLIVIVPIVLYVLYNYNKEKKEKELLTRNSVNNLKANENKGNSINNRYSSDIETPVAGVTYNNRQEIIKKLNKNSFIELRREYKNQFDNNAIAVYANSNQIGYIPKNLAADLAGKIDRGEKLNTSIVSIVGGGNYNYGVNILIKILNEDEVFNNKTLVTPSSSDDSYMEFDDYDDS